jgi:chromosome partitioning protein
VFTIALVCQKGGAGKTTVAVHLAIEAQSRGFRTLVVDLDAQASAAKILERRGEDPPDVVTEQPGHLEVTMAAARKQGYDLVILDTEPHAGQGALRSVRVADLIITPFRPSIVDLDAVQTTIDVCSIAGKAPVFVLNAISPQGVEAAEARVVVTSRGGLVSPATLGDRKAFRRSFNDGQGARELEPKGKAAAEIAALFDALNIPGGIRVDRTARKVADLSAS